MLCPLCGEPATRVKSRLMPMERVVCEQCGRFNISNIAVLLIKQQTYKFNLNGLVRSVRRRIKSTNKRVLIDQGFIKRYKIL